MVISSCIKNRDTNYKRGYKYIMKENFWSELPRPFFILAPMEDVTDIVFRHVVSEAARPDVFFTEFTNTESFCHPEAYIVCVDA